MTRAKQRHSCPAHTLLCSLPPPANFLPPSTARSLPSRAWWPHLRDPATVALEEEEHLPRARVVQRNAAAVRPQRRHAPAPAGAGAVRKRRRRDHPGEALVAPRLCVRAHGRGIVAARSRHVKHERLFVVAGKQACAVGREREREGRRDLVDVVVAAVRAAQRAGARVP
eukprot:361064-Chlamydomonas_euryale.AAC.6